MGGQPEGHAALPLHTMGSGRYPNESKASQHNPWRSVFSTAGSVDGGDHGYEPTAHDHDGGRSASSHSIHAKPPAAASARSLRVVSRRTPSTRDAPASRSGSNHAGTPAPSVWVLSRRLVKALVGTVTVDHGNGTDMGVDLLAQQLGTTPTTGTGTGTPVDTFSGSTPPSGSDDAAQAGQAASNVGPSLEGSVPGAGVPPSVLTGAYTAPPAYPKIEWSALTPEGKAYLQPVQYHAVQMLRMAVDMVDCTRRVLSPVTGQPIQMRFGIHTGNIVGGVLGTRTFRYDIFGPDVLCANHMESNGIGGGIVVSCVTRDVLIAVQETPFAIPGLRFIPHNTVEVTGLGPVDTFIVSIADIPLVEASKEPQHG